MAPIKRLRRHMVCLDESGVFMPIVLMMSALLFAAIGILLFGRMAQDKNKINKTLNLRASSVDFAGPQNGLVYLAKRLSYLPDRISIGLPLQNGGAKMISDSDIGNYINLSPASFWVDWMNGIKEGGEPVPTQPDFVLIDPNTVAFTVETSSFVINIKLISAFNLAPVENASSSGYNNVTLRYGYEISSQQKTSIAGSTQTTLGKSLTISSIFKTDSLDKLIQVHLVRELSRFNLFAISDTMPDGTILYDRTSYSGQIYLGQTFYVGGTPTFGDAVLIAKTASPSFLHQTLGSNFSFKKLNGAINAPKLVDPIDMPTTSTQNNLKSITHKMDLGQNPDALTSFGVYVGTSDAGGDTVMSTIYVNGTDGLDTIVKISQLNATVNQYQVIHGATNLIIGQDVNVSQTFVIFVEGKMYIEGTVAEGTKVTISATQDVIITNDLTYASGIVGPNTVIGLVSWTGNILVSNNILPPVGQGIKNLVIHGVLMAVNGAIGAQGFDDFITNYPSGYVGTINHSGAIIRKWNLPTLSIDGTRGWGLQTVYDPHLTQSKAPPYFPANGYYKLIDQNLNAVVEVYTIKS